MCLEPAGCVKVWLQLAVRVLHELLWAGQGRVWWAVGEGCGVQRGVGVVGEGEGVVGRGGGCCGQRGKCVVGRGGGCGGQRGEGVVSEGRIHKGVVQVLQLLWKQLLASVKVVFSKLNRSQKQEGEPGV